MKRSELPPQTLYHYCPAQSFLEIIKSGSLWLNHSSAMNDSKELRHLETVINDWEDKHPLVMQTSVQTKVIKKLRGSKRGVFLVSFSEDQDVLSQWRAYADDAAGFCIGFDSQSLPATGMPLLFGNTGWGEIRMVKINYHVGKVAQEFTKILARKEEASDWQALMMESKIVSLVLQCKSPAFSEEKEWRIVYTPAYQGEHSIIDDVSDPLKTQYRNTRYGIFPYHVYNYNKGKPIRKVILGPRNPSSLEYITAFLEQMGHTDVEVERSSASYR
jgi:hypothetical protein